MWNTKFLKLYKKIYKENLYEIKTIKKTRYKFNYIKMNNFVPWKDFIKTVMTVWMELEDYHTKQNKVDRKN